MKRWLVFFLLSILTLPSAARAEFYRWTDGKGEQHYTNDKGAIPAEYLGNAEIVETKPLQAEQATSSSPGVPAPTAAPETPTGGPDWAHEAARGINKELERIGKDPLTEKEVSEMEGLAERWGMGILVSLAVSLLTWLGLVIHAFATGRIGWGLANLLLGITAPIYAIIHVGGKREDPDFRLAPKVFLPISFFLFIIVIWIAAVDVYVWVNGVAHARGIDLEKLEKEFTPPPAAPPPP
ncbi:MAG: DUF4124 domain-containing protein [Bdellovibrionota bacterium]